MARTGRSSPLGNYDNYEATVLQKLGPQAQRAFSQWIGQNELGQIDPRTQSDVHQDYNKRRAQALLRIIQSHNIGI